MVLLRNLTKHEINLQNQMLFLAKIFFLSFDAGIIRNKFRENSGRSFYGKGVSEETGDRGPHGPRKSTGGAAREGDHATHARSGLGHRLDLSFGARPYIP
jgi:hypothetical protein